MFFLGKEDLDDKEKQEIERSKQQNKIKDLLAKAFAAKNTDVGASEANSKLVLKELSKAAFK